MDITPLANGAPGAPVRVLLASEDPGFAPRVETLLREAAPEGAHEAVRALGAEEARREIRERAPRVALLHGPLALGGDGGGVLREAWARGVPAVVLLSGEEGEGGEREALAGGAADVLAPEEWTPRAVRRALRCAEAAAVEGRDDYLRALLEHASDVIAVIDAEGIVRFASPSVQAALGLRWDEVEGEDLFSLVHPEDTARVRAAFAQCLETGTATRPVELRLRHRDGGWRTHEALGQPMAHRPGVEGVLVSSRDVTERKEAEAALRRSEDQLRAWHRIEAIGKLAGGIAHDLNNLLTVIKGNTALLRLDRAPGDPSLEDVAEIERAADRASEMTRQLLAFSRKQVLRPQVLDLNALVLRMDRMLRRLVGEDVEMVTVLAPELGAVEADPGQVEQVLVNLVVNARDAMPLGGTLTVELRNEELAPLEQRERVTVPPMPAGAYVVLSVEDTGCGMDEETQRQMFEPFFTTKAPGKGTGLGLSTVYGIVKQSGGFIWVESEVGRGSTLCVYLPRASAAADAVQCSPAEEPAGHRETILLVEDQDAVRRVVARTLARCGYAVLEATNGEEAMRLAESHAGRIDLVLSDVVMPLMSGTQLAEWLAEHHPEVRVLFMSGYSEEVVAQRGGAAGTPLIQKPFQPVALAHRVREVLDAPPRPRPVAARPG